MSLFEAARTARENAYAPYSKFKVGAAVKTSNGAIFAGCNVENVAYPEGTCAEAGALAAMAAAGGRKIVEVLVIADTSEPIAPCGGCRQKLAEFGDTTLKITLADLSGPRLETTLAALLPGAFSTLHLEDSDV